MAWQLVNFWHRHGRRLRDWAIVALGIAICQVMLYGSSLVGLKILLPLDILARRGVYLPQTPEVQRIPIRDLVPIDIVTFYEPARVAAVASLARGELPIWSPNRFAGAPAYRWCLSPPYLPAYLIASPVVLAWVQLLVALVAGLGAYVFFRRTLDVGFWPAAIAAWCYPLSGAFVVWQGFWLPPVMCWLPWLLLAIDHTVRRPLGWGGPCMAALTGVVLVGGALDVAGLTLLAGGIYALWRLVEQYGRCLRRAFVAVGGVSLAWAVGILLVAWMLFPMYEYVREGERTTERAQGVKERPPVGLAALPQVVLPRMYGDTRLSSYRLYPDNLQESSAAGYAGLVATLFVAPLAWCSRRHRWRNALWATLVVVSLSWTLNVPGLVQLAKLPGLNMLSFNRFVFVTAFAILALAAVGLEVLAQRQVVRRGWFVLPAAAISILCLWCCYRTVSPPEPIATQLSDAVHHGAPIGHIRDMAAVLRVQQAYMGYYAMGATLCCISATGWGLLWAQGRLRAWFMPALGAVLLGELLWFAAGCNIQSDPALYYPRLPVLDQLAKAPPGRILGCDCLPANLPRMQGLRDIRGYDGVDPERLIDVMRLVVAREAPMVPYAFTQWFVPQAVISPRGDLYLSPLLDMLNVRYMIFRGSPRPGWRTAFRDADYWVLENKRALPRAYVPRRVESIPDEERRLAQLSSPTFDPRQLAVVEAPAALPAACRGKAAIVEDSAQRVVVQADMETAGLAVLADRWDPGWAAYVNGKRSAILATNHALRGVVVPAGRSRVEFRYEPASLAWGVRVGLAAAAVWLSWLGLAAWRSLTAPPAERPALERAEQLVAPNEAGAAARIRKPTSAPEVRETPHNTASQSGIRRRSHPTVHK